MKFLPVEAEEILTYLTHSECDADNITFCDFCCFRCASF